MKARGEDWRREVERGAEEILQALSRSLEILTLEKETYYPGELHQPLREDGKPSPAEERESFRKGLLSLAPSKDEEGNLRVEAAGWAR
jgi:Asp-tRNA(Asn)/Glu-tRNA(Gln) amidotransferase C subunit